MPPSSRGGVIRQRFWAAVSVALALVLSLVAPAAAEGAPPVVTGAVFNNPKGTAAEQDAVKNHIIAAIDKTQAGRTLRAALYVMQDQDFTDALVAADQRGVNVRVVLDHKSVEAPAPAPAQNLIAALGTDKSQNSWVQVCSAGGACIAAGGTNPINHNKFFTFSRVGDAGVAEDVVIQSSANQTVSSTTRQWNNAYTVVGNTALYTAYTEYFNDLAAMSKNSDYYRTGEAGDAKYYFFPQQSGDVVLGFLNNVSCTGNTTTGTTSHKTIVRISAWALHRDAIATKLRSLADQDCWIEIVYKDSNDLPTLQGHARIKPYHLDAGGYFVHSKYLLVEGNYAGHPDTKWTFTGSHNLDVSSLRENDEALIRLEGAAAHDAYKANFLAMRAQAVLQ
ncbi:phosphatidylserine/phosphatidylglycerophosphate/cardiolipin synthase family protein [Streptomyces sp. NPDC004330]|uniref:phospholipase D-like domain-containing protein n=1 Tax=Streptomyces sp. NPDC004330 TaxID=3364700 RepID=UPI0036AB7485